MTISNDASNAREAARQVDGTFGEQHLPEPDTLLASPFASPRSAGSEVASPSDATADADVDAIMAMGPALFAEPLSEPDETPLRDAGKGVTDVSNASVEIEDRGDGFTRMRMHMNGRPDMRVFNTTAAEIYRDLDDDEFRSRIQAELWKTAEDRAKVSLLTVDQSGSVRVREGTMFMSGDGQPALLPKGQRRKGHLIRPDMVVDAARGYGHAQALADSFRQRAARFVPAVSPTTASDVLADLPVADPGQEPPSAISAVYMVDGPDFTGDGPPRGCLFFATDVMPPEGPGEKGGIVNGYLWAPEDSGLYSESGSQYVDDLVRAGGKVRDYQPGSMQFRDCWQGMPKTRVDAYQRIMGRPVFDGE